LIVETRAQAKDGQGIFLFLGVWLGVKRKKALTNKENAFYFNELMKSY